MPLTPVQEARRQKRLARARDRYTYLPRDENQLAPISVAKSIHKRREYYTLAWNLGFLRLAAPAWCNRQVKRLRFAVQKATYRFDKLRAYEQVFPGRLPRFAVAARRDDVFAWWRVAGANPLGLRQERDLAALRRRIRLLPRRIEARLEKRLPAAISLEREAAEGRLFSVDFRLIQAALGRGRHRDSRWREKYLPAPIGVFLEAPAFYGKLRRRGALVPLAIQIDQVQPGPEPNPVYYPEDGWRWRIAKLYFEVADVSFNAGCGHVFRTHFQMQPFAMATPRQLSRDHPISVLLEPHLRFTLRANQFAYRYFIDRKQTYADFYAGTLEETRRIAIQSYRDTGFLDLELEADLSRRGVDRAPAAYPYRDDAREWLSPIRDFVTAYIDAFYADDASVREDRELQAWFGELVDPDCGALRKLVPGDRLDARSKLIGLLAQVLFIAGPGHASQHYPSNYYYRYAPAFPGAAYIPPPWKPELVNAARHLNTLPPIGTANRQVLFSTFGAYRYDTFGNYSRYRLGRLPQAAAPIRRLQSALEVVERTLEQRQQQRMFPYDFLLPSRVPNSVNF
jgi:arachidonate 15-lipoxygenase